MKRLTAEKLGRFYLLFAGEDHILVLINADPDAIASAMAVKRLLWRKVASVTIAHVNVIKRPDNIAMIRLLRIKMAHVDEIDPSAYTGVVMVDGQPGHHEKFAPFTPRVVIDHHPETSVKAPFVDIRPKYGATATIMTEYLRAAKIKPSAKLATGLFHAIKIDTHNFEHQALIEDVKAFQFLFRHSNIHLARKIEQVDLRLDFLRYFVIALQNMQMRRNRVFVYLGSVSTPDVCVIIADFFMRVNPVKWSFVSAVCGEKLIVVARNDGIRKNAGKVVKQSFGQFGSAGGHKSMSRAELLLDNVRPIVDTDDDKAVARWVVAQIEHRAGKS